MNHRITTDRYGYRWERIDKRTARRLVEGKEHMTVLICPVNYSLCSPWHMDTTINYHEDIEYWGDSFDAYVNRYEYYNCTDRQLGYYAAFYIPADL